MFDLAAEDDNQMQEIKYHYIVLQELPEKELLKFEKEMLGIYISGHPLEKIKESIEKQTTINTLKISKMMEDNDFSQDGRIVKYAGIITAVKKKYTKRNTVMAFITVEDLYGTCEIIVFDSCYSRCSELLNIDSVVLIEGRLSAREDDVTKIVAQKISTLDDEKTKVLSINVTELNEEQKGKLRGALKFFRGDSANISVEIQNGENVSKAGAIYLTNEIFNEFVEIVGKNVEIKLV